MTEITKTEGGFTGTIIVAEHNKNRIRVIGRFGQNGCELRSYEAVLEIGEEWTDGYEIEIRHALTYDHPDAMDHDEWTEKIEFFVPAILWGDDQEYEALVTDEHRSLVAAL
jgi:hypothetical protein|tara:strand:+ start:50 stop:382 length:333 start_codon:yes stop_codon:yes gene_type:complete